MGAGDPNIQAVLDAAQKRIREAAAAAIDPAEAALKSLLRATPQQDRGALTQALAQLSQSRQPLLSTFEKALRAGIDEEVWPKSDDRGFRDPTDWKAVGLVGEDQMDERLASEKVAQFIAHECEAELRELAAYTGEMLDVGWADPSRNPLRGDIVAAALSEAIETVVQGSDSRRLLLKEIGQALARQLPSSYRRIAEDFAARGFRQVDLAVRASPSPAASSRGNAGVSGTASGPSAAGAAPGFEAMRELWEKSILGRMPAGAGAEAVRNWEASIRSPQGLSLAAAAAAAGTGMDNPALLLERLMQAASPFAAMASGTAEGAPAPMGSVSTATDANLMHLLRRLNGDGAGPSVGSTQLAAASRPRATQSFAQASAFADTSGDAARSLLGGLATTNLIRAHHDELVQASPGQLDHMVIEVVASLFDQILADARVPPQIAREIARLQLPVLRVALRDTSFFSSRKHAVRRFINRISALATSFGELERGPGKDLLVRIHDLVSEIVEGDFDQVPLYAKKLGELEQFIAAEARAAFESSPAAATLQAKEVEWQLGERFSGRLQEALEPLPMPAYLKTFLSQVWSRAIVAASRGESADPTREKRFRRAAFDLVASIQAKRSAEQRSQFIAGLRGLTSTLDEGLALIAWPKAAHDEFFGKLVADHMGSLKASPGSDLDHNMLLRQLDAAARLPLPDAAEAASSAAIGESFEPRFDAKEAQRLGLLDDAAVDWTTPTSPASAGESSTPAVAPPADAAQPTVAPIELDLDLATRPAPLDDEPAAPAAPADASAFPTLTLFAEEAPKTAPPVPAAATAPVAAAEPEEPTEGPRLRHHLQIGASYRLQLKDQWEKVRLTYMNPSRTFFLFAHGSGDRGTISMTTRMLQRLCEARKLKAFEDQPLIDRATERVRSQAAAPAAAPAPTPELSTA